MKIDNIVRYSILGIFVLWLIIAFPNFYPIPEITSFLVFTFAKTMGMEVVYYGEYLIVNFGNINRIFHLSIECAGIILYIIFLTGTFLIPKFKLSHRLVGLFFLPILLIANALRILMSVYIAKNYGVEFSLFFHDTIGQVFIFGIGIFSYIGWLYLTGNFTRKIKA